LGNILHRGAARKAGEARLLKLCPNEFEAFRAKFMRYVQRDSDGCWLWVRARDLNRYGCTTLKMPNGDHAPLKTHRVSYILHIGAIPDRLFVCHHCDNPPCVRPDHLFVGTAADNAADMVRKGRNTGPRGPHQDSRPLSQAELSERIAAMPRAAARLDRALAFCLK